MRRFLKRVTVWYWVVWTSRRGAPRDGERGSQSLEWVGLGLVVMAIMGTALETVKGGLGAGVGQALTNFLKDHIVQ